MPSRRFDRCKSWYIRSDISAIDSGSIPDVPTLLIISDGTVTDGWIGFEPDYPASLADAVSDYLRISLESDKIQIKTYVRGCCILSSYKRTDDTDSDQDRREII